MDAVVGGDDVGVLISEEVAYPSHGAHGSPPNPPIIEEFSWDCIGAEDRVEEVH